MCAQSLRHVQLFATPWTVPGGASAKGPAVNAGDVRDVCTIPGLRRSLGGGHGNPL